MARPETTANSAVAFDPTAGDMTFANDAVTIGFIVNVAGTVEVHFVHDFNAGKPTVVLDLEKGLYGGLRIQEFIATGSSSTDVVALF